MRTFAICSILSLVGGWAFADIPRITDEQFEEAIATLKELVAIPSISNPYSPDYKFQYLEIAAQHVAAKLQSLGLSVMTTSVEGSAPFVLAQSLQDPAKPTILLYAHYDVQPVFRDQWKTDPFVVVEKEGRLYGRGASDDKAGIVSIITVLDFYRQTGRELPVNIKLLFEGEEEYGSTHMQPLLERLGDRLNADALVILDGSNAEVDTGSITSSTRGLIILSIKVNALQKPVHSGIGCLAPDPAQALAALLYSLQDLKKVPGFMDDAEVLSEGERAILAKGSQSAESYAREMGVVARARLRGSPRESVYERIVVEPSLSVIHFSCGQPNGANAIQDSAWCTFGIRVTPGQNPDRAAKCVMDYLKSQAVLYDLPFEVTQEKRNSWAWKGDATKPFSQKYLEALGENFSKCSVIPCGGALPLLNQFQTAFPKMEMIIPAVEDPHCAAHSHNESQDISVFRNAINSLISFFEKAGAK